MKLLRTSDNFGTWTSDRVAMFFHVPNFGGPP